MELLDLADPVAPTSASSMEFSEPTVVTVECEPVSTTLGPDGVASNDGGGVSERWTAPDSRWDLLDALGQLANICSSS